MNAAVSESVLAAKAAGELDAETKAEISSNQGIADNAEDKMEVDEEDAAPATASDEAAPAPEDAPDTKNALPSETAEKAASKSPAPATEAPGATGTAPSASTAGQDVEMSEDAAKEREEGMMERTKEDVEAEATTEMEGSGHNIGGGPAV